MAPADPADALLPEWHRRPVTPAPVHLGRAIAQVCAVYPGEFRDGAIPWRLFWLLYRQMPHILALQRVQWTQAVALGAGLALVGEKMRPYAKPDLDLAFPDG